MTLVGQYIYYSRRQSRLIARSRFSRRSTIDKATPRYRTLSAVAANVAAAAAMAAHDTPVYPRSSRRWPTSSVDRLYEASGSRSHDGGDEDENYQAMADSFHSEGGRDLGRSRNTGRISASLGRQYTTPSTRSALPMDTGQHRDSHRRGRSLFREGEEAEPVAGESQQRRSSRHHRRATNMTFLGVFALFSIGSLVQRDIPLVPNTSIGWVMSPLPTHVHPRAAAPTAVVQFDFLTEPSIPEHPGPPDPPSNERIIGRIFAWLCTTLYLTSRMPQIWKNVGLSKTFLAHADRFIMLVCPQVGRGKNSLWLQPALKSDVFHRDFRSICSSLRFLAIHSTLPQFSLRPTSLHLHLSRPPSFERAFRRPDTSKLPAVADDWMQIPSWQWRHFNVRCHYRCSVCHLQTEGTKASAQESRGRGRATGRWRRCTKYIL